MGSLKSPIAPTRGAPPSDLAEIIHSRAWSRLQDIVQRLTILVELVDEGLTPLLPPFDGRPASAVRRLRVRLDDESLREAIQRSMQTYCLIEKSAERGERGELEGFAGRRAHQLELERARQPGADTFEVTLVSPSRGGMEP